MKKSQKIVITGGPGSGKTSLINALHQKGYAIFPEVSRLLIKTALENGVENYFEEKPLEFSATLLKERKAQYSTANKSNESLIFIDRGLPDVFAYLAANKIPHNFDTAILTNHPYDHIIFLPPWKEIYQRDRERFESFTMAEQLGEKLFQFYSQLGYSPITIPPAPLTDRCELVINAIVDG